MPIKRRSTPTLEVVVREIEALEERYRITTEVYLVHDCRSEHVDEDDGMQWAFLNEQRRVLRDATVGAFYSKPQSQSLENHFDSPQDLAA